MDKDNAIEDELAQAFSEAKRDDNPKKHKSKKAESKKGGSKKKIIAIAVISIGLATLVTGLVFLFMRLAEMNGLQDGEYLVSAKEWVMENDTNCAAETGAGEGTTNCADGGGVIWKFTEIGKGTLTTNQHINDYDFVWAIEDGELLIETDWLYKLENSYDYKLDQGAGILTLTADNAEYVFRAVKKEAEE